jgi:hypothetical protein
VLDDEAAGATTATTARDEDAEQHLVEPRLQVGIALVAAFERQGAQGRLLQQVVSRVAVAAQLQRSQP